MRYSLLFDPDMVLGQMLPCAVCLNTSEGANFYIYMKTTVPVGPVSRMEIKLCVHVFSP